MKKLMLFAVSLLCAAAVQAQQPSTGAADAGVPIEEYVPKVVIEGKWGIGPGEFGAIAPIEAEEYGILMSPNSLTVNSKGEIYVLDFVNNRIQKFNADGKYLKGIPVCSFADENGDSKPVLVTTVFPGEGTRFELKAKPAIVGINIVIDSKDTLHYYLKRIKAGKESGEVWQFRNDKLLKKYSFKQKQELPSKFQFVSVGHNQEELIVVAPAGPAVAPKYGVTIKKSGESSHIVVEDLVKKSSRKIEIGPTPEYRAAKARSAKAKNDVFLEKVLDNGNIKVRVVSGSVESIATEEREYTAEGKLVRRIKSPPGYSHGLDVNDAGVKIVRWEIK